jgi:uncharacterized Zn finger protein|tara:strand:- start:1329 stop:1538 length:210 start_codon:yes stop_codon:yes gene_type:complete
MDDFIKPKINIKEQPTVSCEKCESKFFKEVVMLKIVSKILTGSHEDTIIPFPTYMCNECGHVNVEFELF